MTTLRNKRKLAAINRDDHEDHLRNNQDRNTNSHGIQEDYINQVSEEIEGRLKKKLSQEFSRAESRILGALSQPGEFLLNPQARVHSGPVPETSRKSSRENQGTNEARSQNDPHSVVETILTGIKPRGDLWQYQLTPIRQFSKALHSVV